MKAFQCIIVWQTFPLTLSGITRAHQEQLLRVLSGVCAHNNVADLGQWRVPQLKTNLQLFMRPLKFMFTYSPCAIPSPLSFKGPYHFLGKIPSAATWKCNSVRPTFSSQSSFFCDVQLLKQEKRILSCLHPSFGHRTQFYVCPHATLIIIEQVGWWLFKGPSFFYFY